MSTWIEYSSDHSKTYIGAYPGLYGSLFGSNKDGNRVSVLLIIPQHYLDPNSPPLTSTILDPLTNQPIYNVVMDLEQSYGQAFRRCVQGSACMDQKRFQLLISTGLPYAQGPQRPATLGVRIHPQRRDVPVVAFEGGRDINGNPIRRGPEHATLHIR